MATASSMILRALRLIGEKIPGATLTSNEQTLYLADLNTMLDSWGLDTSMCYQLLQESFALVSGTGSYTIGGGGTFNTARPNDIVDPCFVRDTANVDYPLEIIDAIAYGSIGLKTVSGTYPEYLFYDSAYVSSLATIFLYPKPSSGLTLYINSWKQLQSFDAIGAQLMLPPGYQRAIEFNFAVEVAGGYTSVSTEVAKIAKDSKAAVESLNAPSYILKLPAGVGGRRRSNIFTG